MAEDKVEQITGIIGVPKSWEVVEPGGELVIVDVPGRPGAMQKLRKSEAIRLGLWKEPEAAKAQAPARNKQRRPSANKGSE